MNRTNLAFVLAGCVMSAGAGAQSNVTVYGSIDAGLRHQTNADAAGNGIVTVGSGHWYSNRLGFKGVEDLGGGLKARFTLESGFVSKTGALDNTRGVLFNRTASVGIGGAWGNVDIGRQYTIAFRTEKFLDPLDHHFTGLVPLSSGAGTTLPDAARTAGLGAGASAGVRYDNSVQYSRVAGPLTMQVQYAAGEVAGDTSRGSARSAGVMYSGDPLLLAATVTRRETAEGFANHAYVAGGGFKAGSATVKAGLSRERQEAPGGAFENRIQWAGVSFDATPAVEVIVAAYRSRYAAPAADGRRDLLVLAASRALSKRTNLYAEIDWNRYRGALVPASGQGHQRGIAAGINHLF